MVVGLPLRGVRVFVRLRGLRLLPAKWRCLLPPLAGNAHRWAVERKDKAMITEMLRNRFSVRKFLDRPIPDNVVRGMLEAGRLSPSGGNEQPWAFGVITDRTLIAQIVEIAYQQEWIAKAPLLIVL